MESSDHSTYPRTVSERLKEALYGGRCVLVAGPTVAEERRLPQRGRLLRLLGDRLDVGEPFRSDIQSASDADEIDRAIDLLVAILGRAEVTQALSELLTRPRSLSILDRHLSDLPFAHALTTTIDGTLPRVFRHRKPLRLTPGLSFDFDDALVENRFLVIELFGSVTEPTTLSLTVDDLRQRIRAATTLTQTMISAVAESTLLFLGMEVSEIESLFGAIPALLDVALAGNHVALVSAAEAENRSRSYLFKSKYNIELVGYFPRASGLLDAVRDLELSAKPYRAIPGAVRRVPSSRIDAVHLENIGPFERLDIEFDERWNLLLGDNGSGKTTILRAIAFALCGEIGPGLERAAQRLLRAEASEGLIEIHMSGSRYRTVLTRFARSRVDIQSPRLSAVQEGNCLAIGFPALRGIAERRISGPGPAGGRKPVIDDLLSLARGTPDNRLDDLKQWLVNTEYRARSSQRLDTPLPIRHMFNLFNSLDGALKISFAEIDPETFDVWVTTPDGTIPLEQLSQGVTSVMGWLGYIAQRLFEVNGDSRSSLLRPAVILIDEIDAHLHPIWQRQIVPLVSENFPSIQVIATTHSPLLVQNLSSHNVLVVTRDPDDARHVIVTRSREEPSAMQTDELIMSGYFGLDSTRPIRLIEDIDRYGELSSSPAATAGDVAELERLRRELPPRLGGTRLNADQSLDQLVESLSDLPDIVRRERIERFLEMTALASRVVPLAEEHEAE